MSEPPTCAFSDATCSRVPKYRMGDGFVCGEHIDWALATLDAGESIRVHRLSPHGDDIGSIQFVEVTDEVAAEYDSDPDLRRTVAQMREDMGGGRRSDDG